MFGRKGLARAAAPEPVSKEQFLNPGIDSVEHAKVSGELFAFVVRDKLASGGQAPSLELTLGLLAAAGGVASIDAALRQFDLIKDSSDNPNLLLEQDVAGKTHYVGDLPCHYLLENNHAVLCLALNQAIEMDAPVTLDLPHEAMRHTMQSIGTFAFGCPRLPDHLMPPAAPIDLAALAWPQAVHTLDLPGLAPLKRPAAIGFAIAKVMAMSAGVMAPLDMARIVVEYAVPMAAVDPFQFPAVQS